MKTTPLHIFQSRNTIKLAYGVLGILIIMGMIFPRAAQTYTAFPVHHDIARLAAVVLAKRYPDVEFLTSGQTHLLDAVAYGAQQEDLVDVVYGLEGSFKTATHFWDADSGPLDIVNFSPLLPPFPNAFQKATILWDWALNNYQAGNKTLGYTYLGHVAHLLADMSVPAHTHEDMHDTDLYEDYTTEQWSWMGPSFYAQIYAGSPQYSLLNIPQSVPQGFQGNVDPRFYALYYLMYTTNQRADAFGSDDEGGDLWDSPYWGGWSSEYFQYLIANGFLPYAEEDSLTPYMAYIIAQNFTIPYAISATATLYEVFGELTDSLGPPAPVPSTVFLLSSGLVGLLGFRRKARKSKSASIPEYSRTQT